MGAFPTSRLVLFAKILKNGKRSVALRVTYRRKSRFFFLNRQCTPDQWDKDSGRFTRAYPDHRRENDILRTYEQRASDALRDMERDGVPFTFERFEQAVFRDQGAATSVRLSEYLCKIRDELAAQGRFGNSRFYHGAANAVEEYRPKVMLSDLDEGWIRRYEGWLSSHRKLNHGGLSIQLRVLRSACNRAIRDKLMPRTWYPFENYSLAHLKKGKAKKAAPLEFFRALEQLSSNPEQLTDIQALALDLFLFSFYTRGMNLADIAELTTDNLQGGRLMYVRKKTGRSYSMRLNERAAGILDRYKRENGEPIFPVYKSASLTDKQKHYRRDKVSTKINRSLREIADLIGWSIPGLSFYTARHSYAHGLKEAGVSVDLISEALGHADVRTTDAYLKSFGDQALDDADRLLF